MNEQPLRVLQVSASEGGGGAERVACNLHRAFLELGHTPRLAVGFKHTLDPSVITIPNESNHSRWTHICWDAADRLAHIAARIRGAELLRQRVRNWIAQPWRQFEAHLGYEDFHYPGTWQLLHLEEDRPKIVHCHNLHGRYFDIRVLPWLTKQVPVVLTLHDAWLLTGHCAHSFDCERWKIGCGSCPDLNIYPSIRRDGTAHNWRRKREIFAKSSFFVATPSQWLMEKVRHSILAPAMSGAKIIPNGVDLSVFHPADRNAVRSALNVPQEAKVLLFAANSIRRNIWKDFDTLRAAIARIADGRNCNGMLFIALGEDSPTERIGRAELRFIPYEADPKRVALYYQAADVYIHAAKVDTFPNTILEAMACGTPVVATAVGGIPEQVRNESTGLLVPAGNAQAMAESTLRILTDSALRIGMSQRASTETALNFNLEKQANEYMEWYKEIISSWTAEKTP